MEKEVILLAKGGMKELKERLKELKVQASEPTILRALRNQSSKKENVMLYNMIRRIALEMGGGVAKVKN
ncbi:MAG: hypothetical protein ACK5MH_05925 [Bacteroidales bacterium]